MTLPLAAQLDVWRLDFQSSGPGTGDTIRDFDLRTPAVVADVIVGLNLFPASGPSEIHVYEVDGSASVLQFVRLRDVNQTNLEGRSVVRSLDGRGYCIAGVQYVMLDTMLIVAWVDTGGRVQWAKRLELQDAQGQPYEIVVPTKIDQWRDHYVIGGYARRADEQDAFVLGIDDRGAVRWVMIYRDIATPDHDKSPLWNWDLWIDRQGRGILAGSRVTRFGIGLPPAPCENERQQGWMVLFDAGSGTPLSNGVYTDYRDQCVEFRKVRITEEPATGKEYVVSVGWGNRDIGVTTQTVFPAIYGGELMQLSSGEVTLEYALNHASSAEGGKAEYDRYEDVQTWVVADTMWDYVSVVGTRRDSGWTEDRGQYWFGQYGKGWQGHGVYMMEGHWYWRNPNQMVYVERLRHMEVKDTALYLLGYWGERGMLWRTEGRIQFGKPGKVGDGCFEFLLDSHQEKVLMYEEMMEVVKGQVREMDLRLEQGGVIFFGAGCQATLP